MILIPSGFERVRLFKIESLGFCKIDICAKQYYLSAK